MIDKSVPEENLKIYQYLFGIEIVLRELIIESLDVIGGPKWYNTRLPADVLANFKKGFNYEKKSAWFQLIPHHPIYYINFPDLKKIIERKDNWSETFVNVFSRKDILSSTLSELEFIRNKIAHNRKASIKDVKITEGAYTKLLTAIGKKKFFELSNRCTSVTDIPQRIIELKEESEKAFYVCSNCEPLKELIVWNSICGEWWFDETYLQCRLDEIVNYFETIKEYKKLKRTRGVGFKIEEWIKQNKVKNKLSKAQTQFDTITDSWREA